VKEVRKCGTRTQVPSRIEEESRKLVAPGIVRTLHFQHVVEEEEPFPDIAEIGPLIDGVIDDLFCEHDGASKKGVESMPDPTVTFAPLPEINTFLCETVPFLHETSQLGTMSAEDKEPFVAPQTEEGGRNNKSSDRKPAAAHDASRKGDSYVPKMIGSLVIWKGSERYEVGSRGDFLKAHLAMSAKKEGKWKAESKRRM